MYVNVFRILVISSLFIRLLIPAFDVAAQEYPPSVLEYVRPGESIHAIIPINYQNELYDIYFLSSNDFDDPYGRVLYENTPNALAEKGITGVLVTRSEEIVTDEAVIRNILLIARTAYVLYQTRTAYSDLTIPVDDSLTERVESLRTNPLFVTAFIEQNVKALFDKPSEEYAEAFRSMLIAQAGGVKKADEFIDDVVAAYDETETFEDAIDHVVSLAKYSNDRDLRQLAKKARETFGHWQYQTNLVDTGDGLITAVNAFELASLGMRMIFLSDLELDRAGWLDYYSNTAGNSGIPLDGDQQDAASLVIKEANDDWLRRGEIVQEFIKEKSVDLGVDLVKEEIARQLVQYAWKEFGKRNIGHLAAGAAYQVLLGFTIANLLYGMDDIYHNFTIADRSDELRRNFRQSRLLILEKQWPENPSFYDGDLIEAYRTAYLLEVLAAAQVYRSYADGVTSSRLILKIGDLFSGGEWTRAINYFRESADNAERNAELHLGHPPVIEGAVDLVFERLAAGPRSDRLDYDSMVVTYPEYLTLKPGEVGSITIDIQNTGFLTWAAGGDFALANTNEQTLGAAPVQLLSREIPPGYISRWVISLQAPPQAGLYRTTWQLSNHGEPFGTEVTGLVIVAPNSEIELNPSLLFREWLDGLLEDLQRQFSEWLRSEIERQMQELLESLQKQFCGGTLLMPMGILLGTWVVRRKKRHPGNEN